MMDSERTRERIVEARTYLTGALARLSRPRPSEADLASARQLLEWAKWLAETAREEIDGSQG